MLNHELDIADVDAFYEELIDAQRDLSDTQAEMLNVKLLFMLANHIGDMNVLREAFKVARANLQPA